MRATKLMAAGKAANEAHMRVLKQIPAERECIRDAAAAARSLLDEAQKRTQVLIEERARQAETIERQAEERGYAAGRKRAAEELISAEVLRRSIIESSRETVIELVFDICKEVLGVALELSPESIILRIERAMSRIFGARQVLIAVSALDAPLVTENIERLKRKAPSASLAVVIEEAMLPGNARLVTEVSTIEASLQEHLDSLEKAFSTAPGLLFSLEERDR